MAKYETVRSSIKTGDIVLFSGKGGISEGIKIFTQSKWSHVGMALRLDEFDTVLLWESTTLSNLNDVLANKAKRGVQLVLLKDRLDTYGGEVSIRHLKGPEIDRQPNLRKKLVDFRKSVRNRPYEKSKVELMKAAYDGPFGRNEEDLSSLFCSELVAEAYQTLGLLDGRKKAKPSNEYTPKDFSDDGRIDLLTGASLTAEKKIVL